MEQFLQIGDALLVDLDFLAAPVALLQLLHQVIQCGLGHMAIDDPLSLAVHKVMVEISLVLVRLPADIQRSLGILLKLRQERGQGIPAAFQFILEHAMDCIVFFRYFHAVTMNV